MNVTDAPTWPWLLRKRWARLLAFGLFPAVAAAAVAQWRDVQDYIHGDPAYCAQCHVQKDQYVLWEQDAHHNVRCQRCHQQSLDEAAAMLKAYASGERTMRSDRPQKMHAGWVDDGRCLACHQKQPFGTGSEPTDGHRLHLRLPRVGCLTCHARGIHRRSEPESACRRCHEESVPKTCASDTRCGACHAFGRGAPSSLPTRGVCLDCHQARGVRTAEIAADAHTPQFACAVCHRPHAKNGGRVVACTSCHGDDRPAGKGVGVACTACHRPHGWQAAATACAICHPGIPPTGTCAAQPSLCRRRSPP